MPFKLAVSNYAQDTTCKPGGQAVQVKRQEGAAQTHPKAPRGARGALRARALQDCGAGFSQPALLRVGALEISFERTPSKPDSRPASISWKRT